VRSWRSTWSCSRAKGSGLAAALQLEDAGARPAIARTCSAVACGFINEPELEQTLRRLEAAAATGHWDDARQQGRELQDQLGAAAAQVDFGSGRWSVRVTPLTMA